jgi:DNA-binding GntR family transcriptional regulator
MPDDTATVPEHVAHDIQAMIIAGEIAPGDKLPEAELAARFAVSRSSLREAYRLLARERLVDHIPNRGVFVNRPGLPEVVDVFHVRRLIEPSALAEAGAGHPAVHRMREAVARARTAASEEDWRTVGTADVAFHEAVVALADSPILADLYRSLSAQLRLMFGLLGSPRYMHEQYIDRNAEIAELTAAGRPAEAAEAMHLYLRDAESQIAGAYVSGRVEEAQG